MLKFDKALRNAGAASFAIKVGGMGLGLLATIMLARLMGPASYGEYAFVFAILSLLSIPTQIGLPTLVVRETSKAQFEAAPNRIRAIWKWANTVVVLLSLSLAAILLLVFWIFPIQDVDIMTLLLGLPLVPLIAVGNIRGAALRGLGRVILGQIPETLLRPALIMIGLAAYATISGNWTLSAPEAMFVNMLAMSVAFGFGTVFLLRSAPAVEASSEIETGLRSKWLKSAMILGLMSGMQAINGNADLIMLGFFRTNAEVGTYRVAVSVASTASISLMSLNVVLMPRIAQMHAAGELRPVGVRCGSCHSRDPCRVRTLTFDGRFRK